jgi:hypothetical protein
MNDDEFDAGLIGTYRSGANESPAQRIDERVLLAAKAHASRQRLRRYLIPLAAAAGLAIVALSGRQVREISAPKAQSAQTTRAAGDVTAQLLRLQPPLATHSAVTDFLLNSNSLSASDMGASNVP